MVTPALHGDRAGIEDQRQFGVAQHGCAGVEADVLEHRGERLDDDLFRIGEPIDDQAEAAAVGIEHGDKVVAVRGQACTRAPGISSRSRKTSGSSLPRRR